VPFEWLNLRGRPCPPENPYSPEKAELGRKLFFDPLMSPSGTISCATCHHPRLAWSDGLPRAAQASSPVCSLTSTVSFIAQAK
jgi:cytochrome c peroxidase